MNKMTRFFIIILLLSLCQNLGGKIFKIDERTSIENFVPLELQDSLPGVCADYKLEQIRYGYGNGLIDKLVGKSIISFITWTNEWEIDRSDVFAFNYSYNPLLAVLDFENPDLEERGKSIKKQEEWFAKYGFQIYPNYVDCDFEQMLKKQNILICYHVSMPYATSLNISLRAYVPNPAKRDNIDSETSPYIFVYMEYCYKLELPDKDNPEKVRDEWLLLARNYYHNYENPNFSPQKQKHFADLTIEQFINSFKWKLNSIVLHDITSKTFERNNYPRNFKELFF